MSKYYLPYEFCSMPFKFYENCGINKMQEYKPFSHVIELYPGEKKNKWASQICIANTNARPPKKQTKDIYYREISYL